MTIENLIKVIPPPAAPFDAYAGPWEPVEGFLGLALPQDYKDFVRLYGSGYMMSYLGIYVPRSRSPHLRITAQVQVIRDRAKHVDDPPMWPEPGGLLVFGRTDFGDELFWQTLGPPKDWRVVVFDRGGLDYKSFGCDLTDFLAGIASGEITSDPIPDGLLACGFEMFKPYTAADFGEFRMSWRTSLPPEASPWRRR